MKTLKNLKILKKKYKKEFDESIVYCEKHNNTEIEERARSVEKSEVAATVIGEFEEIIGSEMKNIIWLTYQQGIIFRKFKEREKFAKITTNYRIWRQQIDNLLQDWNR